MADDARLQIVLEAKIDKLTEKLSQANSVVSRSAKKMSDDLEHANQKWEHMFLGEGPGAAIERVFSRSRLAVFEEGTAKIPLFGSALEALGPAGLTAAAALAAVGVAAEETHKAMEFAEDVERTSKALGISTTALQEYDYAFAGTSIGVEKGRQALAAFNEVFGKYSAGLASGKSAKFLDALGFTPESARELGSTQEALEKTLAALAKIKNPQQRAALATQLGLSDFLVVLAEGQEGVDSFLRSIREANGAGAVISPEEIRRAAELNDKLHQVEQTISVQLKEAFIDLAPYVVQVAQLIAGMARDAAQAAKYLENTRDSNRQSLAQRPQQRQFLYGFSEVIQHLPLSGPIAGRFLRDQIGVDDKGNPITPPKAEAEKPLTTTPGVNLAPPKKVDPNKALELAKASADAIADANKQVLDGTKAQLGAVEQLTDDAQVRLGIQTQQIEAERDAANVALEKRRADLASLAAQGKITQAAADQARASLAVAEAQNGLLATIRITAATRAADLADAQKDLDHSEAIDRYYDAIVQTTAGLARTSAARRDAELRLLAYQKAEEDRRLELAHTTALTAAGGDRTQIDKIDSEYRAIKSSQADKYASDQARVLHDTRAPIDAFRDSVLQTSAEVGEALQSEAVKGLNDFNDELAEAVTNGKILGDVMHAVFTTLLGDAVKYLAKQAEVGLLDGGGIALTSIGGLFGLGHNASGTDNWRGGPTVVGENGPEVLDLPRGATIAPNSALRGLANIRAPRAPAGGPMSISVRVDAAGAFGREDLNAAVRQGVAKATSDAVRISGRALPGRLNAYQQLGT